MLIKQLFTSLFFCTIFSNSIYAMNKDDNNDDNEFCHMTCHRPSGYWQMGPALPINLRLSKPTSTEDQREPWHMHSNYVAEPFCTVSNLPFFAVAYALKNSHQLSAAALTFAGSASAMSHAIPYQFLNDIDKGGAMAAFAAVAYDADLSSVLHSPKALLAIATLTTIKFADFWAARSKHIVENSNGILPKSFIIKRKPKHTWIHVFWHLLAAYAAYVVLTI